MLTDGTLADGSASEFRRMLSRLEAVPNTFVPFPGDTVVRLDTVYPMPRAVAVLVDHGCASSCEDFVLMAEQSRKVTIVGVERTAGVHDYGNVRAVWLPGWRRLRIPTTRSHRLPDGAIDNVGIAPGVWVPTGASDTVRFAARAAASAVRKDRLRRLSSRRAIASRCVCHCQTRLVTLALRPSVRAETLASRWHDSALLVALTTTLDGVEPTECE